MSTTQQSSSSFTAVTPCADLQDGTTVSLHQLVVRKGASGQEEEWIISNLTFDAWVWVLTLSDPTFDFRITVQEDTFVEGSFKAFVTTDDVPVWGY